MDLTPRTKTGERPFDVPADVQGRAGAMLKKLDCKMDETASQLAEELSSPERQWMLSYHQYQCDRLADKSNAQDLAQLKKLRKNIQPRLSEEQSQLWQEYHLLVDQMEVCSSMLDRCNMTAHT